MQEKIPTLNELAQSCSVNNERVMEVPINLAESSLQTAELQTVLVSGVSSYMFKSSEKSPKDPKVTLATRQLCKYSKVPMAFFLSNRGEARDSIVNTWLKSMDPSSEKSVYVMKLRKGIETMVVRSILPVGCNVLGISDAVDSLKSVLAGMNPEVVFVHGDDRDATDYQIRVVFGAPVGLGNDREYRLGVSISSSDLDAVDTTVDVFLYDTISKTFHFCNFGGNQYFSAKPGKFQQNDITSILTNAVALAEDYAKDLHSFIPGTFPGTDKALHYATQSGVLPKAMYGTFFREMEKAEVTDYLDFARHVALVAKDQPAGKRTQLERSSGSLMGLNLLPVNTGE